MRQQIREIDIHGAKERLDAGDAVFVDIRDPGSFAEAHIAGATLLDDSNAETFLTATPKDATVIVYCYHGNSSIMGASYFVRSGFNDVFSMAGGFESWRTEYESES